MFKRYKKANILGMRIFLIGLVILFLSGCDRESSQQLFESNVHEVCYDKTVYLFYDHSSGSSSGLTAKMPLEKCEGN